MSLSGPFSDQLALLFVCLFVCLFVVCLLAPYHTDKMYYIIAKMYIIVYLNTLVHVYMYIHFLLKLMVMETFAIN